MSAWVVLKSPCQSYLPGGGGGGGSIFLGGISNLDTTMNGCNIVWDTVIPRKILLKLQRSTKKQWKGEYASSTSVVHVQDIWE